MEGLQGNILFKWMITRGTPVDGNPHIFPTSSRHVDFTQVLAKQHSDAASFNWRAMLQGFGVGRTQRLFVVL